MKIEGYDRILGILMGVLRIEIYDLVVEEVMFEDQKDRLYF